MKASLRSHPLLGGLAFVVAGTVVAVLMSGVWDMLGILTALFGVGGLVSWGIGLGGGVGRLSYFTRFTLVLFVGGVVCIPVGILANVPEMALVGAVSALAGVILWSVAHGYGGGAGYNSGGGGV